MILGVGHPLRGDDGLGPALVARLKGKVKASCFDGGSAPEVYAGRIVKEKPDTIVLIDALHLGREAGGYAVLEKEDILRAGFSTHDLSPRLLLEYLERETGAAVYLLGVQPSSLGFGTELSAPVRKTLIKLEKELIRCMN